jgi:hypothetical protein
MSEAAQYGPAETVRQLCNGYRVSQALYVAAQLQIAEHLATGALSSAVRFRNGCGREPESI